MKVEKLERVALHVKNLGEAVKLFSDLFGTTFYTSPTEDPKLEKRYDELGEDGLSNFLGVPEFPDAWSLGWVRAGEEYEFFKPVFVGDTISVKLKLLDVFEKRGRSGVLIFTTSEARYTNQDGELLATQKITMIATPRKEETND